MDVVTFSLGESSAGQALQIGIIGDFIATSPSHLATNEALGHAANALAMPLSWTWMPTLSLDGDKGLDQLELYDALWCAPGSPYKSTDGALSAIRFAREHGRRPFIGT